MQSYCIKPILISRILYTPLCCCSNPRMASTDCQQSNGKNKDSQETSKEQYYSTETPVIDISMYPKTDEQAKNNPYYLDKPDPRYHSKRMIKNLYKMGQEKLYRKLRLEVDKKNGNKMNENFSSSKPDENINTQTNKIDICQEKIDLEPKKTFKRSKSFYLMSSSDALANRVAIDLSFSRFMNQIEMNNLAKQAILTFSANRRCPTPLQLYLTSFKGVIEEHVKNQTKGRYLQMDIHFKNEHFLEVFPQAPIIYLSPDSPNVITTLDSNTIYIIGGLVDESRTIKNLTYVTANELKIQHGKLPIKETVGNFCSPRPLPINIVFQVLLNYICTNSWEIAIKQSISKKKIMTPQERFSLNKY